MDLSLSALLVTLPSLTLATQWHHSHHHRDGFNPWESVNCDTFSPMPNNQDYFEGETVGERIRFIEGGHTNSQWIPPFTDGTVGNPSSVVPIHQVAQPQGLELSNRIKNDKQSAISSLVAPPFARVTFQKHLDFESAARSMAGSDWIKFYDESKAEGKFVNTRNGRELEWKGLDNVWLIHENAAVGLSGDRIYQCNRSGNKLIKGKRIKVRNLPSSKKIHWFVSDHSGSISKYLFWINHKSVFGLNLNDFETLQFDVTLMSDTRRHQLYNGCPFIVSCFDQTLTLTDVRNGQSKQIKVSGYYPMKLIEFSPDNRHLIIKFQDNRYYLLRIGEWRLDTLSDIPQSVISSMWITNDMFIVIRKQGINHWMLVQNVNLNTKNQRMIIPYRQPSKGEDSLQINSKMRFTELLSHSKQQWTLPINHLIVGDTLLRYQFEYADESSLEWYIEWGSKSPVIGFFDERTYSDQRIAVTVSGNQIILSHLDSTTDQPIGHPHCVQMAEPIPDDFQLELLNKGEGVIPVIRWTQPIGNGNRC